uniref:Uncharacterized protein n=1 Tax=Glossina austeni TaxID=7395 RepID=A0A1A9VV39_GLOAU
MNSIHRNCMSLMSVIDSIFYESNTHLAPGNTSVELYPNRSFFAALVAERSMLRKIYFLLLEVIVVGMMTLTIMYVYNIKWIWPEKKEMDASERSLKTENAELIKPLIRLEQLVTPDGNSILVLKMGFKRNLPNSVASNKMQNSGSLLRLHDTHLQAKHKALIGFNFSSLASSHPGQRSSERNSFLFKYKTTMPSMLPVCVARRSKQKQKN